MVETLNDEKAAPGAIVVSGTIGFASKDDRDGAVAASRELQAAARTTEPGCLAYVFAADPIDDTIVAVYELWTDAAALDAHFAHPNYTAMRQILRQFERSGPSSTAKYRCDAIAPVYGPDNTPSAQF